jgi:hypothetical protein
MITSSPLIELPLKSTAPFDILTSPDAERLSLTVSSFELTLLKDGFLPKTPP